MKINEVLPMKYPVTDKISAALFVPAAALFTALFALFAPSYAAAHGVEVSDVTAETAGAVQTARFMYSTGEPMAYAKIRIYPPSKPDTEVLQAISAWNGYFSFVPDEEGNWRVTAEDGMGHKGEIVVEVRGQEIGDSGNTGSEPNSKSGGGIPLVFRAVLGLSLLANIFAVWYFITQRRKQK